MHIDSQGILVLHRYREAHFVCFTHSMIKVRYLQYGLTWCGYQKHFTGMCLLGILDSAVTEVGEGEYPNNGQIAYTINYTVGFPVTIENRRGISSS